MNPFYLETQAILQPDNPKIEPGFELGVKFIFIFNNIIFIVYNGCFIFPEIDFQIISSYCFYERFGINLY